MESRDAPHRVLVVDDEAVPRSILRSELEAAGLDVVEARDGAQALERIDEARPHVVVTDKNMPRKDGIELLAEIRTRSDVPVIMFTAFATVESAVSAMKAGASDYVSTETIELRELVGKVSAAARSSRAAAAEDFVDAFPGGSEVARSLRKRLQVYAPLRVPVLLRGARGTDKGRLVRALHDLGPSSGDGELVEFAASEFDAASLGRREGAIHLTGAEDLGSNALAFCEELALKSDAEVGTALRLFVSTEVGLGSPTLGRFFERFLVEVPQLADQIEDLGQIVPVVLDRIGEDLDRGSLCLSTESEKRIVEHRWPGNEQQLTEVLTRAAVLSPGRLLELASIEQALEETVASVARIRKLENSRERDDLLAALRQSGGNILQAGKILKVSRSKVYRLMDKHRVSRNRRA